MDNAFTRDVERRIEILTESIESKNHGRAQMLQLQVARRMFVVMLTQWRNGEFIESDERRGDKVVVSLFPIVGGAA